MAVTIKDVARTAGVSIATVSRVMNGGGTVNEALRNRVEKAVSLLGYVPNSSACSLKNGNSKLIGITASDLSVAFFPEVVKHVEKAFQSKGYATIVSSTYDNPENEMYILEHMISRHVDALLVNSTGKNEEMLRRVALSGIPVIFYDRRTVIGNFPFVCADKAEAVELAVKHLASLGHRRIALVTGSEELMSNIDRLTGFRKSVEELDLDEACCAPFFGEFSESFGENAVNRIMEIEVSERPTAAVTGSIAITAGIISRCREIGVNVPGDLSIVSAGSFTYGKTAGIDLTYVSDMVQEISEGIINLLTRTFEGETLMAADQIVIEPELHVGESTAKVEQ